MDDWREQVKRCPEPGLAQALVRSIEQLFEEDIHALRVGASERHLAAELARHLTNQGLIAPDGARWDVHVEYNRKGTQVKTVNGVKVVVPDIIIHRAGSTINFLAIELKKGNSSEPDMKDVEKLKAYRSPYELGYAYALFLRLGVGRQAGTVSCVVWV